MADLTVDNINNILTSVVDKYTEQDIVSSNAVNSIEFDGDKVEITVELNYPAKGYHNELSQQITDALAAEGINNVNVTIETKIIKYSTQKGVEILSEVKILLQLLQAKVALVNQLQRLT